MNIAKIEKRILEIRALSFENKKEALRLKEIEISILRLQKECAEIDLRLNVKNGALLAKEFSMQAAITPCSTFNANSFAKEVITRAITNGVLLDIQAQVFADNPEILIDQLSRISA